MFAPKRSTFTQTPQVAAIVVSRVRIFVARDHLGRHPIRRADERVAATDRPIQLSADTEID